MTWSAVFGCTRAEKNGRILKGLAYRSTVIPMCMTIYISKKVHPTHKGALNVFKPEQDSIYFISRNAIAALDLLFNRLAGVLGLDLF